MKRGSAIEVAEGSPSVDELIVIDDRNGDDIERVRRLGLEALIEEGDGIAVTQIMLRELSMNGNLAIGLKKKQPQAVRRHLGHNASPAGNDFS